MIKLLQGENTVKYVKTLKITTQTHSWLLCSSGLSSHAHETQDCSYSAVLPDTLTALVGMERGIAAVAESALGSVDLRI